MNPRLPDFNCEELEGKVFSDIFGFAKLKEDIDPETLGRLSLLSSQINLQKRMNVIRKTLFDIDTKRLTFLIYCYIRLEITH